MKKAGIYPGFAGALGREVLAATAAGRTCDPGYGPSAPSSPAAGQEDLVSSGQPAAAGPASRKVQNLVGGIESHSINMRHWPIIIEHEYMYLCAPDIILGEHCKNLAGTSLPYVLSMTPEIHTLLVCKFERG